ncbi:glycosyltransferase family 1 protein [Mycobacterium barrassiae]|uniref:glycosyltransferase n=1 Tax=Mycobacterium barrassiae TaxID=319709 RepID=UPI002265D5CF|nr:glycosyltransferase [Mycobacterium barrassiae]MCV7300025.1 glycosyltransferase family 1 protein [Mycobacterium barrassiae]
MRVLLSTWGSRGDVEPMFALAVQLQARGVDVLLCAPPDFAEQAARIGVPMRAAGKSVRALVHGGAGNKPSTPADAPRVAAELVASQFETVAPAAEGCDAIVATGLMPAGQRSIAESLGIYYACVAFMPGVLPSPHQTPLSRPGRPFPPSATNKELWEVDAERVQALYGAPLNAHRAALGLPPVDNVRDHVHTDRPWLAADPILAPWPGSPDFDVVQTGAWILPDTRPLPAELTAFLEAGTPPVYVGFSSVRAPEDVASVAVEAIRAQGHRVLISRGWADLEPIDDRDDCLVIGEVNLQALFPRVAAVVHHGGAGTTTTAARAGVPQVVVPQIADQPYWAGRVAALGIGAAHDGANPTRESLSAALATALAPDVRARAAEVAGTIRGDGAAVAAKLLVDAVSGVGAGASLP